MPRLWPLSVRLSTRLGMRHTLAVRSWLPVTITAQQGGTSRQRCDGTVGRGTPHTLVVRRWLPVTMTAGVELHGRPDGRHTCQMGTRRL